MQIRQARPEEAPQLAEIYVRAWRHAFADILPREYLDSMDARSEASAWQSLLDGTRWPKAGALLAVTEQKVVAFAGFGAADEAPATAELGTLYALPEVWGTGVGRQLMAATMAVLQQAEYRHATLWVLEANARARRFYTAAGWHADGTVVDDVTAGASFPKLRYYRSLG